MENFKLAKKTYFWNFCGDVQKSLLLFDFMVWCAPTKVAGGIFFWDNLKVSDHFYLQKHKSHGTRWSSAIISIRSVRITNAGTFRIIFSESPHYTIAESNSLEEVGRTLFCTKNFIKCFFLH